MIFLIVYVDILVILNVAVDYLLLLTSAKILGKKVKTLRLVLSSLLGGVSCIYIFLPSVSLFGEIIYKILISLLLSLVAFGFNSLKAYIKSFLAVFVVSSCYAGLMLAVWQIFKPGRMIVKNSVVYFDISPIVLVIATTIFYFCFTIINNIFSKNAPFARECEITVAVGERRMELKAILDTGNSLTDFFGNSEIIITDKNLVEGLLGSLDKESNTELSRRYRAIPCSTVSGNDMLDGFRCDTAVVCKEKKSITLKKPILAVAKSDIKDGYNAIVNPKIFE